MLGLIDVYMYLMIFDDLNDDILMVEKLLFEGDVLCVLWGVNWVKSWLENGFIFVKDLGDFGVFLDVVLKKVIVEGSVVGFRMFVLGLIISLEGG